MCLQCLTNPWYYGEFSNGWYLTRSTKDNSDWPAKVWGLLQCNDPTHYFNTTPTIKALSDPEWKDVFAFREEMAMLPEFGADLVQSFKGINIPFRVKRLWVKHHLYNFTDRFFAFLADFIQHSSPVQEEDPFPNSGKTIVYDPKEA